MDGNAGIRGESVEMTRSGFERCSKNEQPTLAIENSLFVQRFLSDWENDKAREGLADQNEAANAGSCSSTCASGSRSAGSVAVSMASSASDADASSAGGASGCAWLVG